MSKPYGSLTILIQFHQLLINYNCNFGCILERNCHNSNKKKMYLHLLDDCVSFHCVVTALSGERIQCFDYNNFVCANH